MTCLQKPSQEQELLQPSRHHNNTWHQLLVIVQWLRNGGKCGVCGDAFHGVREHEAGGKYANGIITRTYQQGQNMPITVHLTANHQGWFEIRICPVKDPKKPITQECLDKHVLNRTDGKGIQYLVPKGKYNAFFNYSVQLPPNLYCEQCVVQWKYRTGNTWDKDNNSGVFCLGCGPQEEFYNCADIRIIPNEFGNTVKTVTTKTMKSYSENNIADFTQTKPADIDHLQSVAQKVDDKAADIRLLNAHLEIPEVEQSSLQRQPFREKYSWRAASPIIWSFKPRHESSFIDTVSLTTTLTTSTSTVLTVSNISDVRETYGGDRVTDSAVRLSPNWLLKIINKKGISKENKRKTEDKMNHGTRSSDVDASDNLKHNKGINKESKRKSEENISYSSRSSNLDVTDNLKHGFLQQFWRHLHENDESDNGHERKNRSDYSHDPAMQTWFLGKNLLQSTETVRMTPTCVTSKSEDKTATQDSIFGNQDWIYPATTRWWHDYIHIYDLLFRPQLSMSFMGQVRCHALFHHNSGMDDWCTRNCNANFCPSDVCMCRQDSKAYGVSSEPFAGQRNSHWIKSAYPQRSHRILQKNDLFSPERSEYEHSIGRSSQIRSDYTLFSKNKKTNPSLFSEVKKPESKVSQNKVRVNDWERKMSTVCHATGRYASLHGYNDWCQNNCARAMCPLFICQCKSG